MVQEEKDQESRDKTVRSAGRRRFLGRLALGAAALSVGGAACANQMDDLEVIECEIPVEGWPAAHDGYTIGHITDIHCDNAAGLERTKRAVATIMARKPTVAVFTGDYASIGSGDYLQPGIQALRPLLSLAGGIYAILGNHDYYGKRQQRVVALVSEAGIPLLRNQSAPIPGVPDAYFVGLDDVLEGEPNIPAALQTVPSHSLKVLLVHEPDFADAAGSGFALQLSGHSHGGQVRIPGLPPIHEPPLGRRYPEGLQMGPHHPIYTSKGVGVTGLPLRLCCRPDVTIIHLRTPNPNI